MTTTKENLVSAKARWEDRRDAKATATLHLRTAIRDAAAEGMPQAEIARTLGWPRQRVNTLLQS